MAGVVFAKQFHKALCCGAELMTATMNNAERPGKATARQRHGDKRSSVDFAPEGRFGQNRHTGTDFDSLLDILDIVEFRGDFDGNLVLPQKSIDFPADRQAAVEVDVPRALELIQPDRRLPRERMPGRTSQHHPFFTPWPDLQLERSARKGDEAQIGGAVANPFVNAVGMKIFELNVGARVLRAKALDIATHVPETDGIDRHDLDRSRELCLRDAY